MPGRSAGSEGLGKRKSQSLILPLKVKRTVDRFKLLKKGDKVLIACSGGPDSMGLLAVMLELRPVYSLQLSLAHFNHRLRRSADRDERFVIETARRHNIPLYLRREDIRSYALKQGLNIEEAGRRRRYEFLRATAARIGATKVATGHTLNDQAETVLLRLLRGSGPGGLAGIAPMVDGLIIRPLLDVERSEVEAYLKEKKISFCEDESNQDIRYHRNRIRLRLIPYLQKHYEPGIVRNLARLAEIAREDEEWATKIAGRRMQKALILSKGRFQLDAALLAAFPPALARRCVREFILRLKGDLRRISLENVEAVRGLGEGGELHLPGGLVMVREKSRIFLKDRRAKPASYEHVWDGKRALEIGEAGLRFAGKKVAAGTAARIHFADDRRAYLDAGKLRLPLVVRSRREGDRYRPLGAPGRKKLKELMRAKAIPLRDRSSRPVFLSRGEIVWVLSLPVADEFKVTPDTKTLFVIEKE
jgi:tRNA(Ile)-lysidine synthase